MAFQKTILVANPSPYQRSDFVEVDDLKALGVPPELDSGNLRLMRQWPGGSREEVACQIDYPFGKLAKYRSLTFFARDVPPGDPDYRGHTAQFSLEEGPPRDFREAVNPEALKVEHCSAPGTFQRVWDPKKNVIGVELSNAIAPTDPNYDYRPGMRIYFSLVPRPEVASQYNYAGAATSILHYRSWLMEGADVLAPHDSPHSPRKRWGQLTALDFYPMPWERRYYQTESLLGEGGREPAYTLAWSNAGPLRATVTLQSEPIQVHYNGAPFLKPDKRDLRCRLYRIIFVYPEKEFYTEQLVVRPEGDGIDPSDRISLSFRAHYYSYLDYPNEVRVELARSEKIPDYFAVWRWFGGPRRGYAFASDSHVRALQVWPEWPDMPPAEIRWRLQLGHEHRCVHLFPLFLADPAARFEPFHEVGHTAWYERLWKPLQVVPLNRYVSS